MQTQDASNPHVGNKRKRQDNRNNDNKRKGSMVCFSCPQSAAIKTLIDKLDSKSPPCNITNVYNANDIASNQILAAKLELTSDDCLKSNIQCKCTIEHCFG